MHVLIHLLNIVAFKNETRAVWEHPQYWSTHSGTSKDVCFFNKLHALLQNDFYLSDLCVCVYLCS